MSGWRKKKRFVAQEQERVRRRQFTAEERKRALEDLAVGIPRHQVANALGCSCETLRLWKKAAVTDGTMPEAKRPPAVVSRKRCRRLGGAAPPAADRGGTTTAGGGQPSVPVTPAPGVVGAPAAANTSQLGSAEQAAILEYKRKHPSMGPAQIRAQLKRFHGWRVAVRAIARVLTENGYKLERRASRPEGDEVPHRFEAPFRNALWQLDFADLRIGEERRQLLIIEDDFSRFVVGHLLVEHPTSEVVVETMREAVRRHGKPGAVYTDRGGAFLAWRDTSSFQAFLETELIDHHVGRPYHPQGRGKVEAVIHTLRRELWDTTHFDSVEAAEKGLVRFFHDYNHHRAHMGIDGLVPADRFFGRWEQVRAEVEDRARQRPLGSDPRVVEERLAGGPVEVLRLMVVGDRLEFRWLGHVAVLGTLRP